MFESLVVQVQQSAFVGLDLDRVEHRVTTTIAVADESHIVTFLDFKGEFDVLQPSLQEANRVRQPLGSRNGLQDKSFDYLDFSNTTRD